MLCQIRLSHDIFVFTETFEHTMETRKRRMKAPYNLRGGY